jgi:hypothetical protein
MCDANDPRTSTAWTNRYISIICHGSKKNAISWKIEIMKNIEQPLGRNRKNVFTSSIVISCWASVGQLRTGPTPDLPQQGSHVGMGQEWSRFTTFDLNGF